MNIILVGEESAGIQTLRALAGGDHRIVAVMASQTFVELLAYIEKEFGTEISLDRVEFGDFRSVAKIAEYVDAHSPVLKV